MDWRRIRSHVFADGLGKVVVRNHRYLKKPCIHRNLFRNSNIFGQGPLTQDGELQKISSSMEITTPFLFISLSLSLRVKHVERNHVSTISTMLTERTAIKSQEFLLLYVLPTLHALTPHLLSGGQPVFPRIQPSAKTSGERNEIRPRQRCRGVLV